MDQLPVSVQHTLRRLRRRLTFGIFLDHWPRWAAMSLLGAGVIALACRLWFPETRMPLVMLWLAPIIAAIPAVVICVLRAYPQEQIAALADSLHGGQGTLLSLMETRDQAWSESRLIHTLSELSMPRLRFGRRLLIIAPAAAFLAIALMLPQRIPAGPAHAFANDIASDLQSTLNELRKQNLVTPDEDKEFQEEIDRIRKDARERLDASSWEASDSVREKFASTISEKQDAVKWASDSLSKLAASGASSDAGAALQASELGTAIDKLARAGLLANAPADLQKMLGGKDAIAGGKAQLPGDPQALRRLAASLSNYLQGQGNSLSGIRRLSAEAGRFDPSEFSGFSNERSPDGDGDPGSGGVNRGRADAELTYGEETWPYDRFKSLPLPPGAYRSPDDWSPVAVLPGAPTASPELSVSSAAIEYAGVAGQSAWRRTLAPRHYSAVKKYFEKSPGTDK